MKRFLLFKLLMVLILPGLEAADSIHPSKISHETGQSRVAKGRHQKAAAQKKKEKAKQEKRAASDSEESLKDDIVMEHPFDMRSMKEGHIEIVKNNLNNFFRHNKQNVEDLKAATTREEKLIIFERIRQSNACLMHRYRNDLKKLKKDFYSLLIFLNDKKVSESQADKDFMEAASSSFWLINRFGDIVREYSALQ